jgi:LysR family transcriptional regulator, hydrogen peroxide-inducible genes activator
VLEEALTAELLERIRNETLDVALIATPDSPDLVLQPLFEEPLLVYVSRSHPLADRESLTPGDLPREDFWLLSEAHCLRAQTLQLCQAQDGPLRTHGIRVASGNLETLKRLVQNGDGFTLLPALAVDDSCHTHPAARLIPFVEPAPTRQVALIRRRVYLKRGLVSVFLETLLESLPPDTTVLPPPDEVQRTRRKPYFANLDLDAARSGGEPNARQPDAASEAGGA